MFNLSVRKFLPVVAVGVVGGGIFVQNQKKTLNCSFFPTKKAATAVSPPTGFFILQMRILI
jgi:hypothetical protein